MQATPVVETERLTIRRLRLEDAPQFFALKADPSVSAYDTWDAYTHLQQAVDHIARQTNTEIVTENQWVEWAVVLKTAPVLVGVLETIIRSRAWGQMEIGWALTPEFRGKGYATEAARAIVTYAFQQLGMHRIFAECDPQNLASVRLMERLGMRREGHLQHVLFAKGRWCDRYVYGVLAHEWLRGESNTSEDVD